MGPNTAETYKQYTNLKDGEICSNLTFLGNRGLYTASSGIKIAYVSGLEAPNKDKQNWNFDDGDVKAVRNSCLVNKTTMGEYRGVDILITSQWPQGIHDTDTNGSKLVSWLASEIKPRYHFSGCNGVFYERLPYRNSAGPNTQLELATRFISLAVVGNADKSKYIYALHIASLDKMRLLELIQKTTTETPCPYDSMNLMKEMSSTLSNVSTVRSGVDYVTCSIFVDYCRIVQLNFSTIQIRLIKTITTMDTTSVKDSEVEMANESALNKTSIKVTNFDYFLHVIIYHV